MTRTLKATVNAALTVAMLATLPMAAQADTNGMDRRDDRQDCRGTEGLVGSDKRDCKQDSRNG